MKTLIANLVSGGHTVADMISNACLIADQIPPLLQSFDQLRLLVESDQSAPRAVMTGTQLYREVRRIAERVTRSTAKSRFHRALMDQNACREQLVGYALEYYWIVKTAPGLIAPALASAHSRRERELLQAFLKSELGHDRFLAKALMTVGFSEAQLEAHQPLPSTFSLCASLGVYARQHPLSFKASLFLLEQAQPQFVDAFDDRCRMLGLPDGFFKPLRDHADLNSEFDHEDISRDLMTEIALVSGEEATVVKRHVALIIETLVQQENEILDYYAIPLAA